MTKEQLIKEILKLNPKRKISVLWAKKRAELIVLLEKEQKKRPK